MPRFAGVDHFALSVTDLGISHRFYTEILGLVPVFDFGYVRLYLHNPSGFSIALLQHPEGRGGRFSELTTGLDHLGFAASNLKELREWEGAPPGSRRRVHPDPHGGVRAPPQLPGPRRHRPGVHGVERDPHGSVGPAQDR